MSRTFRFFPLRICVLRIIIRDNGVGMSEEKLAALRDSMAGEDIPNSIGLPNISKRLYLTFDGKGSLQITSAPDGGTVVSIFIPAEELQEPTDDSPSAVSSAAGSEERI